MTLTVLRQSQAGSMNPLSRLCEWLVGSTLRPGGHAPSAGAGESWSSFITKGLSTLRLNALNLLGQLIQDPVMLKTVLAHLSPTGASDLEGHLWCLDLLTFGREMMQLEQARRIMADVKAEIAQCKKAAEDRIAGSARAANERRAALEDRFNAEIAHLESRVDKYEAECAETSRRTTATEKDIAALQADMSQVRGRLTVFQAATEERDKKLAAFCAENAKLRQVLLTSLRSNQSVTIKSDDMTRSVAAITGAAVAWGEPGATVNDAQATTIHPSTNLLPEWLRLKIEVEVKAQIAALHVTAKDRTKEEVNGTGSETVQPLNDRVRRHIVEVDIIRDVINFSKSFSVPADHASALKLPGAPCGEQEVMKLTCKSCVDQAEASDENASGPLN